MRLEHGSIRLDYDWFVFGLFGMVRFPKEARKIEPDLIGFAQDLSQFQAKYKPKPLREILASNPARHQL